MTADLGMCPATLLADFMSPTGDEIRAALSASLVAGAADVSAWTIHFETLGGVQRAAQWCAEEGLRVVAVEAALAWASGDEAAGRAEAQAIAETVAAVGATRVLAVTMEDHLDDLPRAQAGLGVLVEHVQAAGAQVCVEFLPWTGIPDLATAWSLVAPLGAGAGLLIDAWHWQRQPGGPNTALLAQIPGERIGYVQLCDAAPGDSRDMGEAMSSRRLPGEGAVDFAALFGVLRQIGAQPFIATEVFNGALLAELGQLPFAQACLAGAQKVMG